MPTLPARIRPGRGRTALLWGVVCFAGLQLGLGLFQRWQPIYRDPAFGQKLDLLRKQLAVQPGRPLVLIQGSSRALFGVRPDVVRSSCTATEQPPVVFNFSQAGAGPIYHLVQLKRLLARGICPDYLFLEVWPCFLTDCAQRMDLEYLTGQPLEWSDLPLLRRYTDRPRDFSWSWLGPKLAPWYTDRLILMKRWAQRWVPPETQHAASLEIDALGWHAAAVFPEGPEKTRVINGFYRPQFEGSFRQWTLSTAVDRAMREILSICQARGIKPVLVFLPEGKDMQSWYDPAIRAAVNGYLERLSREGGAELIDAHTWVEDRGFVDTCHLDCEGAAAFSERLGREVLQPLLQQRHAPSTPLGRPALPSL